jgi:hypothetical protein
VLFPYSVAEYSPCLYKHTEQSAMAKKKGNTAPTCRFNRVEEEEEAAEVSLAMRLASHLKFAWTLRIVGYD